jgi:hypothetical protein
MKNAMEILKVLNKSNCRDCHEATCLAFAAAVFKGRKKLDECPHLGDDILGQFDGNIEEEKSLDPEGEESLAQLKRELATVDLASAAPKLGARFSNGKLTLKILGKDFSVDAEGEFSSDIHIHSWITIPVLNYILGSRGLAPTGEWMHVRELKNGPSWERFFTHRCEKPLKKVADTYTDLFHDMLHIFNGRQVEKHYQSDISLVLFPLPKVPILVCYWRPEEGLESSLHLFFDSTAEDNLNIESLYSLTAGLVMMCEKIALRHGSV